MKNQKKKQPKFYLNPSATHQFWIHISCNDWEPWAYQVLVTEQVGKENAEADDYWI